MANMNNPRTISIVVPALNEEANIAGAIGQIVPAMDDRFADWEIVLVNDGSTDATAAVMEKLATGNRHIRVVHNERNLGFGGAYKRGVAAARFEYVMMVPGDNEHPTEGLVPILEAVGQADIVLPYVVNPEVRPLFRRVASRGFTTLMNLLFGLRIKYYNGLVVHRTALIRQISITTDGFAYQAEALVKLLKKGCSYVELGTTLTECKARNSKALKPKNLAVVVGSILKLYRQVK